MHVQAQKGLDFFTSREFYEAHEYFERAWRETQDDSREFYRVLIHLTGGFFRLTQGRRDAAMKFFDRSHFWLKSFPSPYLGINADDLRDQLSDLRRAISQVKDSNTILETYFPPIQKIIQKRIS